MPPIIDTSITAHLRRIDRIYLEAVRIAEGDVMDALLISCFATLPYRRFPAVLPLLGLIVKVPVSSESEGDFSRRLARLPYRLFTDTPAEGDRDKLPHFFGSAWLQCVLKHKPLVKIAGWLVETAESIFAVEGFHDQRDDHANMIGAVFGETLMEDMNALPSVAFETSGNYSGLKK